MRCTKWGAVIVAAGAGKRFGGGIPKQFLMFQGIPVVNHSIKTFIDAGFEDIAVVVPTGEDAWKSLWTPPAGIKVVSGGNRRQDSVLNGLMTLDAPDYVLIHDGVRPLVSQELIARVMQGTERSGACIPVLEIPDTVKFMSEDETVKETVDRNNLRVSQTPHGFDYHLICSALEIAGDITDESSAVELLGETVATVIGDPRNLKITTQSDIVLLRALIEQDGKESRMGTGLDYHPFTSGKPLMVAGLKLAETGGFSGHSDGDVVLHSIADALLAGAKEGDIGVLFPPSDCRWKDADSGELLRIVAGRIRAEGWKIKQLDITVIGEKPKISPIRKQMTDRIAELLEISPDNIWIKGTTTNTLGELGSGDGLACFSMVELVR